jgi:hypothetical protein
MCDNLFELIRCLGDSGSAGSTVRHYVLASIHANLSSFLYLRWPQNGPVICLFGCQSGKKATLRLEGWPLQMPLNSGFVREPAGGFEPSTCCLRNALSLISQIHTFPDRDGFSRRSVNRLSPCGNLWVPQLWSPLWSSSSPKNQSILYPVTRRPVISSGSSSSRTNERPE